MVDPTIRTTFANACRSVRLSLDLTQRQVADRSGITRSHYAKVEAGHDAPSLDVIDRIAETLGLHLTLSVQFPTFHGEPVSRDVVHACCSAYIGRRLRTAGWVVLREVLVESGRHRGWIDLLAFDPRSGTLLVIECKTRLDDIGAAERQVAWYERSARAIAETHGWDVRRVVSWLLLLSSDETESRVRAHRDLLAQAFPDRGATMSAVVADGRTACRSRGLAMIDPRSRRKEWLIRTRVDGRRSPSPYLGYGHAARILGQR
jgi:transcriptional regulator with XRE-family HTH domain